MPDEVTGKLRRIAPDRYSEFELIGKGGMGAVYLALDSELNRRVAFKIVLPDPTAPRDTPAPSMPLQATPPRRTNDDGKSSDSARSFEELRLRFLQEAWITSGMEHPGVVPVYEVGETEEGVPYYTMRYVRGEQTLKEAIANATELDDRLALLEPFLRVCDTVRYAHARGVVHRDLKPENIGIGEFGEVIVLDWGLAKVEGHPDATHDQWQQRIETYRDATDFKTVAGALGTPGFMSPEAALGQASEVNARSDIYSLGAILFRILTGRLPFEFTNFLEYINQMMKEEAPRADAIDESIPTELTDACARALSKDASQRFEDVAELAKVIRTWQTEGPIDREVRALLDGVHVEIESSRNLKGSILLLHLDRATTALNRIQHLRPDNTEAKQLQQMAKRMREGGIRARVRTDRLSMLQRVAAALLAVGAIVALMVFGMLSDERERTDELRRTAESERGDFLEKIAAESARRGRTERELVQAYTALSQSLLEDQRNAAARLIAGAAVARSASREAWATLAAAESTWTPTLRIATHGALGTALAVEKPNTEDADTDDADTIELLIGDDEGRVHWVFQREGRWVHRNWEVFSSAVSAVALVRVPKTQRWFAIAGDVNGQVAIVERKSLDRGAFAPITLFPKKLETAPSDRELTDQTPYRGSAVTVIAGGLTPDTLLVGYADGRIRTLGTDGALQDVAHHHTTAVAAIQRGSSNRLFYSASRSGQVNLWEALHLDLQMTWNDSRDTAGLLIRPGNDRYTAWSDQGAVWRRTQESEELVEVVAGRPTVNRTVPLNEVLVGIDARNGQVRFRKLDVDETRALGPRENDPAVALAVSRDRNLFVIARKSGEIRVWDVRMGRDSPGAATANHNAHRVAVARADGRIEVRPTEGDAMVLKGDSHARVAALRFDPRGERLLVARLDGSLAAWRMNDGGRIRDFMAQEAPFTAAAWAQGDGRIVTGDIDGIVRTWYWPTGRPLGVGDPMAGPIRCVTHESPADRIAAADTNGNVNLWDSKNRKTIRQWTEMGNLVALALAPSSDRMAALRDDGTLLLCDGKTWIESGRVPLLSRPLDFTLNDAGIVHWIDESGLSGTGREHDGELGLPVHNAEPAWVLIDHSKRTQKMREALGLVVSKFAVRRARPAELRRSINLSR